MTLMPPPSGRVQDDLVWETSPRRGPEPDAAPVLSVEGFEGPLDWLVELARARRIDLGKISILASSRRSRRSRRRCGTRWRHTPGRRCSHSGAIDW